MTRTRLPLFVLLSILVPLGAGCGTATTPPPPVAAPFTVTTLADDGPGSLRAIVGALPPGGGAIGFAPGLAGTMSLVSGPIVLSVPTSIQGPGAGLVTIDGGGLQGLFEVAPGVAASLVDLELRGGAGVAGAAIRSEGDVELVRLRIVDCHTNSFARAGGVLAIDGSLRMSACRVEQCSAFFGGGAAFDPGVLVVLRDCTFLQNSTTGNSGGAFTCAGCHVEATNCTFADNLTTDGGAGGAVAAFASETGVPFELSLSHCTIADNAADGLGGGLFLSEGTLSTRNTIVAGNLATGLGPDIESGVDVTVVTLGHNVIGDATASAFPKTGIGDLLGSAGAPIDPGIGVLSFNGGPTQCFTLLPGSVAIDLVPAASCLDAAGDPLFQDQTGKVRPIGPDCDAGSFESP